MKKVFELEKNARPREKLKQKGPKSLSDFELLQTLIGSGNSISDVSKIANETLKIIRENGANVDYSNLQKVCGLGPAKITEILAAFELSKRYLMESDRPIINSPEKAAEQLLNIRDKKQEHFVVMTLDGANRLIAKRTITVGTLNASLVHPREVFADAITDRAASIIVAHNHPSGNLEPSQSDIELTNRLHSAAELIGIDLLDHIIITKTGYSLVYIKNNAVN